MRLGAPSLAGPLAGRDLASARKAGRFLADPRGADEPGCDLSPGPRAGPYFFVMATVQFGSVLDKSKSDKKVWVLAIPLIIAIVAGVVWGFSTVSAADAARADLGREKARAAELQASLDDPGAPPTPARRGALRRAGHGRVPAEDVA